MTQNIEPSSRIKALLENLYDNAPSSVQDYILRLRKDPTSRVFAPLAENYRKMGKVNEAIEICQQGLKYHPDFITGKVILAKCYIATQKFLETKALLEPILIEAPDNILAVKLLSETFEKMKDFDSALQYYKMALILTPQDEKLIEKITQLEQGKTEELVEHPKEEEEEEEEVDFIELKDERLESPNLLFEPEPTETLDLNDWEETSSTEVFQENQPESPEDEQFKVESIKNIFQKDLISKEITTETLGDLYFSQSQFEQSLKIFERIYLENPTDALENKIKTCREKLGVTDSAFQNRKKIELLRNILYRLQTPSV